LPGSTPLTHYDFIITDDKGIANTVKGIEVIDLNDFLVGGWLAAVQIPLVDDL
jgi:hypothetical protein